MSSKPPDDDTRTNNSDDEDDNFFCLGDAALYMQTTTFNTTGQKRWDAAVAMKEFLFDKAEELSLIHISEPTRRRGISYGVFWM